jgi:hypothetical protein
MESGKRTTVELKNLLVNPVSLFRTAVAKYPQVTPLFAVLAAIALLVIVLSLRISADYALFGVIIVLGLLLLVALAVSATQLPQTKMSLPAIVLVWAVLILSIGSMSLLFTGYFFNWPRPVRPYEALDKDKKDTKDREQQGPPPSLLSAVSMQQSIPRDVIPDPGVLRLNDNLLSGDNVHYVSISNFRSARVTTKYIVLHRSDADSLQSSIDACLAVNRPYSVHVLIGKDGAIVQLLSFDLTAFHCRQFNKESVGIEVVGKYESPLSEIQIQRLVDVLRLLMRKYAGSQLALHRDLLSNTDCPGQNFPYEDIKTRIFGRPGK